MQRPNTRAATLNFAKAIATRSQDNAIIIHTVALQIQEQRRLCFSRRLLEVWPILKLLEELVPLPHRCCADFRFSYRITSVTLTNLCRKS